MNSDYQIYSALESDIPSEDIARLDGYLKGREEAVHLNSLKRNKKPKMATSIKKKRKRR